LRFRALSDEQWDRILGVITRARQYATNATRPEQDTEGSL